MKFYISDLHFGHENIIRLCHRPFSGVEQMDETLIENWNKVVKPDDEVYVLGDIVFRSSKKPTEYFERLNGKKYLVKGNHDKVDKSWKPYFEWIKEYAEIYDNDRKIILSHYPMVEWNGYFKGTTHLFGHIHNNVQNQAFKVMVNVKNAYNVGVEILDYTPRTLDDVIKCNEGIKEDYLK